MPGELAASLGRPAVRVHFRPMEVFIVLTLVLILVLLVLSFHRDGTLEAQTVKVSQTQDQGVVRGYINRAVTCDLQKGLGLHESKGCSDPAIAPYRDALTGASSSTGALESRKTRELVCLVLEQAAKQPRSTVVIPASMCQAP